MKYKQQLLDLILDENEDAMMQWIQKQPLMEQPDIFRELKELAEEIAAKNGEDVNELVQGFEDFDIEINNYQEKILDEKLAEANYAMALDNQEKAAKDMLQAVEGVREYVIECITTNAPNAEEMRELSKQIIKLEIDSGIYKAENWSAIL